MSLVAGKAAAAIPDESGVFHGCYNVFTGRMRVIDGTQCSVLERHVAWQQTGIQGPVGPVGPVGPQGPVGPSNADKMIVGYEDFYRVNLPTAENPSAATFATSKTFTPLAAGTCSLSYAASIIDDALPSLELYPTYVRDGATWTWNGNPAILQGNDESVQEGSTVFGLRIDPGVTYTFGITLHTEDEISRDAIVRARFTWVCKYD